MATVHILHQGKEVAARTMKGLPRDIGDLGKWWNCARRTFKGHTKYGGLLLVYQKVVYHEDSNTIRYALVGGEYQVIIDRNNQLLTA